MKNEIEYYYQINVVPQKEDEKKFYIVGKKENFESYENFVEYVQKILGITVTKID